MKPVVFLGPSLSRDDARAFLDADYRPPAQMGDVYRAACELPAAIVLIDGLFERVPATWHKELLYAMDRGIPVYGGSSMGALRAAELGPFGMVGVGRIHAAFASGALNDDDEVAVTHASAAEHYTCVSVAMVTLRFALEDAVADGVLDALQAAALLAPMKALFYPRRTWDALYAAGEAAGVPAATVSRLRAWVDDTRPDQKRADAIATLRHVAAATEPPCRVAFTFEHTLYWEAVETYYRRGADTAAGSSYERLRNHVRVFDEESDLVMDRALLAVLVDAEGHRLRMRQESDREALRRFRMRRGLHSAQALSAWMHDNVASQNDVLALARIESLKIFLHMRHVAAVDRWIPAVLKAEERYVEACRRVDAKWRAIASLGIDRPSEGDVEDSAAVLAWYQKHHRNVSGSAEAHAVELGMESLHQWREELYAEYLATTATSTY